MSEESSFVPSAQERQPQARWRKLAVGLGPLLAGGALGFGAITLARLNRELPSAAQFNIPGLLLSLPLAMFAAILLHELGHVAGGKLAGFRFLLLVVGPLKVERQADGLRFGLNRSAALAGGVAASTPLTAERLRPRMAAMVAGGPLASWLSGLAALGAAALLAPAPGAWLGFAAVGFGAMSLLLGVVTLIPMHNQGFYSDGARLLALWRGTPDVEHWLAILVVSAQSMAGARPRDWDPALVERAATLDASPSNLVSGNLYAYYRALDSGELAPARRYLARAFDHRAGWPAPFQSSLLLEAAFWAARYDQAPERAAELLALASETVGLRHTRLRAEAGLALVRGDRAGAAELAARALAELEREQDRGLALALGDWLGRLRDEALA